MRCLGIDWGKRKIGLALGDEETKVATPWKVLSVKNQTEGEKRLSLLIQKEGMEKLIVGRPLYLSGGLAGGKEYEDFLAFLQTLNLPLILVDERFSTKAVVSLGKSLGFNRGGDDDADAAAVILQNYFDGLR